MLPKARESRRSQETRRDESRAKILAAAEQLFARDGLAGARTDAIAAAAKVNKALLYYYFKSKEQLYEAVLETHLRDFNEQALGILNAPGSPRGLLLQFVELHFDFISARQRHAPLFQQLMMKGGKRTEKLFRKYIAPRSQAMQKLLERGIREGEFREAATFHTAISLVALVVFYFTAAPILKLVSPVDPYSTASLKQRKKEVLEFVRHALFNDSQTP
jgi:TetR/AcrR family transcriptional regulator